jgi:small subunit ribosomal protein S17
MSENKEINVKARRTMQGIVVSNKMQKTIVVKVDRKVKHTKYKKFVSMTTKYKVHDEKNDAKVGDRVEIVETKPASKEKVWALRSIIERAKISSGSIEI